MNCSSDRFELEQLEPRILLSGNELLHGVRAGTQPRPGTPQRLEVPSELPRQNIASPGSRIGEAAGQYGQLLNIFAGIDELDFSDVDALERAQDEQDVETAETVSDGGVDLSLDSTIDQEIQGEADLGLTGEMPGDAAASFEGESGVSGTSILMLTDVASEYLNDEHKERKFDVEIGHGLTGELQRESVTSAISDFDLQPQTNLQSEAESNETPTTRQSDLTDSPINELTTTAVSGSDSLSAQLVEANNASNPPPQLNLEWSDFNVLQATADAAIIGTEHSEKITLTGDNDSEGALSVLGLAGDDTLVVDFNDGNPIPDGGLTFDGGEGFDTISIYGGEF
ncbi:MAG: LEPR-XLL domain-containing protein, partial [Planctomycetota bacterium]|nr:LEPR-XLL domain-containing protein [Planctomycetota bacterium]